jgi:formylglycine-generating enzyme required for sulfatase activity
MPYAPSWGWKDKNPIVNVSWDDAEAFCEWLGGRLPTEAEWEYAAKGGSESKGYEYSGSNIVDDVTWHFGNSGSTTHPVGTRQANEFGLYDMSGNVLEWCSDWYDQGYYQKSPQVNPQGPTSGTSRVVRGGAWFGLPWDVRCACRDWTYPDGWGNHPGFRVAR